MPASGHQDHTTSPSAAVSFVFSTSWRPSHPAPANRDDREAPLSWGTGRREVVEMICPTGRAKYFLPKDWTLESALKWLTKFDFWRRCGGPRKRLITRSESVAAIKKEGLPPDRFSILTL